MAFPPAYNGFSTEQGVTMALSQSQKIIAFLEQHRGGSFTARQIAESDGARTMKTVAVTLWLVSYALSLIWLPVFFTMESYMAAFVLLAVIAALTTAQFLINIRISLPAALMVLPYWGFVIYCAYVNLMIAL